MFSLAELPSLASCEINTSMRARLAATEIENVEAEVAYLTTLSAIFAIEDKDFENYRMIFMSELCRPREKSYMIFSHLTVDIKD